MAESGTLYSIATTCMEGDLADKLTLIAESGFKGVDISIKDLGESRLVPSKIGQLLASLGLKPVCLQPLTDFTGVGDLSEQRERLEYCFSLMDDVGTDLLLMTSTSRADASTHLGRHQDDLWAAAELAGARKKRIGYEALAWGTQIYSYQQAWDMVKKINLPSLGLIIDSFHILSRSESLELLSTLPPERLFMLHLADAPIRDVFLGRCRDEVCKRLLSDWSRHGRRLLGMGEFDLPRFYEAIAKIGYQGPISLEIFNDHHKGNSTQKWLDAALFSLKSGVEQMQALTAH